MGRNDLYGYELAVSDAAGLQAWSDLNRAFLSHGRTTPDHLNALLENSPQCAIAHACRGLFSALLGRRELLSAARDAHTKALGALGSDPTNDARARAYVDALGAWLAGKPMQAAETLDTMLATYPRDAMAIKLSHSIRFVMGDAGGMRRTLEMVLPEATDPSNAMRGYIQGCYAFALEETGDQLSAERVGRGAVQIARDDAWGLHAVAHVYDMTARAGQGVDWLESREASWTHCNNFRFHVYWHLALFYLDMGDYARVLDLYDSEIRSEHTDDYRDISNGASMLMRLELEGVDVGNRWEELAALSATRVDDGCVVFADLHYMLSLIGGDREDATDQLLTRMAHTGRAGTGEMDAVCRHPGVDAATGLAAFREGHYRRAFNHLQASLPAMQTVGGSHAQRDVFQRVTVEAGIRSGQFHEARQLLMERARRRGGVDAYTDRRLVMIERLERKAASHAGPSTADAAQIAAAPVFVNAF